MKLKNLPLLILISMSPFLTYSQQDPPCSQSEYRQFDFWIGEWDVYGQDGSYQGSNTVKQLLNACVLMENWTGAGLSRGKSFNTYNPQTKTWKQVWVDNFGSTIQFEGAWKDKAMRLKGQRLGPQGDTIYDKLEFHPHPEKGEVHQIWTASKDRKTWNELFYGIYIPKGQKPEQVFWSSQADSIYQKKQHRDFDFWTGTWKGKIKGRSTEGKWEEQGFLDTKVFPILKGKAILEFSKGKQNGTDLQGFSIRYFDEQSAEWNAWLFWPSATGPSIIYPLTGTFEHERIEFFVDWTPANGVPQTTRFTFSDIQNQSFRWDAAISTDDRQNWKTNLIFENTKLNSAASWNNQPDPWFENWSRFDSSLTEPYHQMDELIGNWSGNLVHKDQDSQIPVSLSIIPILDGRAIVDLMRVGDEEYFGLSAFVSTQDWRKIQLSDKAGDPIRYLIDDQSSKAIEFVEKMGDGNTNHHSYKMLNSGALEYKVWATDSSGNTKPEKEIILKKE